MKLVRLGLALAVLVSVTGLAYVAQQVNIAGPTIVKSATNFVSTLTAEQKAIAVMPFESKERTNWNFVPLQDKERNSTRKGLPLEKMSAEQKKAALALVKSGCSESGAVAVTTIMSLEGILRDQEKKGAMVRNPDWYFFSIFGTPSKTGKWGWRVEGHHLSINFTMEGTEVVAATPFFFGANPAQIKAGERKGQRILPAVEDLARKLFDSLSAEQKKVALQPKAFPEPAQGKVQPEVGAPVGLAAAKMTDQQKESLAALMKAYTDRMPTEVGDRELKTAMEAGLEKVHFAFTGDSSPGKGFTYRVHGPTFVIEFLNIQADSAGNPANHIHSAWRRIKGDFGLN